MKHARLFTCFLITATAFFVGRARTAEAPPRVSVVVGQQAPQLEQLAASELCGYLEKLFHIHTKPTRGPAPSSRAVFLVGSPVTNSAVKRATLSHPVPKFSDQGIVLRKVEIGKAPGLIVGGGPESTLWAVYELVERWGVRYSIEGDAIPAHVSPFKVSDLDVTMEPVFRVRAHPTIQDFADSGESWGAADFHRLIDYIAKLKFNRLNIYPFGFQPYLDWECRRIKRKSAWLWYGYHYPIRPNMPGKELFGDVSEFWNPDFPITPNYHNLVTAGIRQVADIIDYAHKHGMKCVVAASVNDSPPEFAPILKDAVVADQLGGLTIVPGPDTPLDGPGLFDLTSAVIRATLNTYPKTDVVTAFMPEHRQWTAKYEEAWKVPDEKYGIGKVISLDKVLEEAKHRKGGTISPERATKEVKGDFANLLFFHRLLRNSHLLEGTPNPNVKIMCWGVAEELFPILDRVMPHGWELGNMPDNFPTHLLQRREILSELPVQEVPAVMDLTVNDDNIGILPHMTTGSLYPIVQDMQHYGWAGFVARERFPGDHDSTLAYLARAVWDRNATPNAVISEQLKAECGEGCVSDMIEAFHAIEQVTINYEKSNTHFAFPADWPPPTASSQGGMFLKYWKCGNKGPVSPYLAEIRGGYQQALDAARRAQEKSAPEGRKYVEFWGGRLEFSVAYVDAVTMVEQASIAEAAKDHAQALTILDKGVETLHQAINAYARVARNQTDKGAIAVADEYAHQTLQLWAWHMRAWGY